MPSQTYADALDAQEMSGLSKFSNNVRDRFARLALLYLFLLAISTITLGIFVVAFVGSLKEDPLTNPTQIKIDQLNPANWGRAWQLGKAGADDPWLGGMLPSAELVFEVTYAAESEDLLEEPVIRVPEERADYISGGFSPDQTAIVIGQPRVVAEDNDISYIYTSGTLSEAKEGVSKTWQFRLKNQSQNHFAELPLTIQTPKQQVLIDSRLPASRIERRGRIDSWDNVAPGLLGYVFGNYVRVVKDAKSLSSGKSLFVSWTLNSTFIAVFKVLLTLAIACTGGYALARFKFPGARAIFFLMLLSMMVPGQVLFISNYLVFRDIGLLNTPWAVIAAVVASGQVLIMKQFFESIPKEVEEAAIVDGAKPFRIMWSIFLPMSKPAIASVVILGFQGAWNDFFWPLVVLTSPSESYTLPVGLLSLRNAYGVTGDWGLILAGSFLSTIPVLLIFMFFQRYFVENDSSSAVKG